MTMAIVETPGQEGAEFKSAPAGRCLFIKSFRKSATPATKDHNYSLTLLNKQQYLAQYLFGPGFNFISMKALQVILIFLFIVIINSTNSYSQGETDNWIFGTRYLRWENDTPSFNYIPGNPVGTSYFGFGSNGCISDKNGKFLLFTNGEMVATSYCNTLVYPCNAYSHDTVMNGTSLLGFEGSIHLILPKPGTKDRYYVIVTSNLPGYSFGLRYSEVDMSLNNGFGAVLNPKNLQPFGASSISGQVSAVRHANGKDIWVLTHRSDNNLFLAYLVTENGFSTYPVGSYTGISFGGQIWDFCYGEMKFSPSGNKLAVAIPGANTVQFFDFDNQTGIVSNPISLTSYERVSSLEFSSDQTLLYLGNSRWSTSYGQFVTDTSYICQLDIISSDSAIMAASSLRIMESTLQNKGVVGLQMTKSNTIFVKFGAGTIYNDTIFVINNPNIPGFLCGFDSNGPVNSNSGSNNLSLFFPNFMRSFLDRNILFANTCYGDSTLICTQTNTNFDSIRWEFDDIQTGLSFSIPNQDTIFHVFSEPGSYEITLKRYRDGYLSQIEKMLYILPVVNISLEDTTLCPNQTLAINCTAPFVNLAWVRDSIADTTYTNNFVIAQAGTYWPVLTNYDDYCGTLDTIHVSYYPDPLDLGNDTSGICFTNPLLLDATINGATGYSWSTNDTVPTVLAVQDGYYWVTVQQGLCILQDTIFIAYDGILPVTLPDTVFLCDSLPVMLMAGDFQADFLWAPNGETTADIFITSPGTYSVTASNGCGDFTDSTVAIYFLNPTVNLGNDTLICLGESLQLAVPGQPLTNYLWSTGANDTSIIVFDQGWYSLSVSNACGEAIDTLYVGTHENQFAFSTDTIFLPLNQTTLIDAGQGYLSYLWSTGATNQSISVATAGMYQVELTDSLGCPGSDSVEVVILWDIAETGAFSQIKIYPNPVKEELVVAGLQIGEYDISLFNSLGQKVHTHLASGEIAQSEGLGRATIDFSGFPIGIYFLAIQCEKERRVFKVVRE